MNSFSLISMNGVKKKSYLKNEIDNLKKVNDERIKEIKELKRKNEDLKKNQGYATTEIRYEVKDFVNNEVKTWKEK